MTKIRLIASLASLALTFGSTAQAQQSTIETAKAAAPSNQSGRLIVRFMGTGTISFDDGNTIIMEDGFFTRPGLVTVIAGKVSPDQKRIDDAIFKAGLFKVAAIFVAHSHYDHALDAGTVALKTGATVIGTSSTANAAAGAGLPFNRTRIIHDGDTFSYGRFTVTAFETPHSPDPSSPGTISQPLKTPARQTEFKEGGNFSYLVRHGSRRILVIASANYRPEAFKNVAADVVFLGAGTLGKQSKEFIAKYWEESVRQTGAKLVIPIHWDNFFESLDQPLRPLPLNVDNFDNAMKSLKALAARDGVILRLPEAFTPIDLDQR